MLRSEEFDFVVRYKSGRKRANADTVSRCSLLLSEDDILLSRNDILSLIPFDSNSFAMEQLGETYACSLIRHIDGSLLSLDRGLVRQSKHIVPQNGVLFQKKYSSEGVRLLLLVSCHLQRDVPLSVHGDPTAGQFFF